MSWTRPQEENGLRRGLSHVEGRFVQHLVGRFPHIHQAIMQRTLLTASANSAAKRTLRGCVVTLEQTENVEKLDRFRVLSERESATGSASYLNKAGL